MADIQPQEENDNPFADKDVLNICAVALGALLYLRGTVFSIGANENHVNITPDPAQVLDAAEHFMEEVKRRYGV